MATSLDIETEAIQVPRQRAAQTDPKLSFVFGAARSGTTWLAKLFDSSPEVLYFHEPFTKGAGLAYHRAMDAAAQCLNDCETFDRPAIIRELIAFRHAFARPPFFRKSYGSRPWQMHALLWYAGRFLGLYRRPASVLAGDVHLVIKEGLTAASLPLSARLAANAIVLFRHPCAVVSSRLRGERRGVMECIDREAFYRGNETACNALAFTLRDVLAMREEEVLALDWLLTYMPVAHLADDCPPGIRWITYETLVARPARTIADLFDYCGLMLSRPTLDFIRQSTEPGRPVLGNLLGPRKERYFSVQRRVPNPDRQWEHELSAESIQRIMALTQRFPLAKYWPE